jgi:UDP-N-acetylmuramoyl-tripeptide--D-alanyl-D-alanine ligase
VKDLISLYLPSYPKTLIYMLQSTEYQVGPYLKWVWRTGDFRQVATRRTLHRTRSATLLLVALVLGIVLYGAACVGFIWYAASQAEPGLVIAGGALLLAYPLVWAVLVTVPVALGWLLIVQPKQRRLIRQSSDLFAKHPAVKIAVAGSYGKTTMKELLGTVLSEGKNVAITPANKNTPSSHARFVSGLTGSEEILVIEYGEGAPGDVARFARTTHPTIGVITGLAPAHLDQYPSLEAAGQDIFSLAAHLEGKTVYVNAEAEASKPFLKDNFITYDSKHVDGWNITNVQVNMDGVSFTMTSPGATLDLHSGLLGRHQVGPLAAVAAIAYELGLSVEQIQTGMAKTAPFEHRMQPNPINGAWILDDTYNGNIEGIKAGLALLGELHAERKIYVTPGLVDQGAETQAVHAEMGRLIAAAKPDKVVLMKNSVTGYIQQGLEAAGYTKEVQVEEHPLDFYTNLTHVVAAGDVVLMQNDWTDNYN